MASLFTDSICTTNVPDWHDKLQEIECHSEQSHSEDINQHQEREEWMILADVSYHNLNDNEGLVNDHNWHIHTIPYNPRQILEMPRWKTSKKQTFVRQA